MLAPIAARPSAKASVPTPTHLPSRRAAGPPVGRAANQRALGGRVEPDAAAAARPRADRARPMDAAPDVAHEPPADREADPLASATSPLRAVASTPVQRKCEGCDERATQDAP